jgi:hypothetical protein
MMVLFILLINVLIRKREMMKVTQKENTHIKAKELQESFQEKIIHKEHISSSDEDEVSDNETGRVLFMAVKDSDKEDSEEEYEEAEEECEEVEEVEIDYQEELMCSIEVIRREKKKNKKLQE